MQSLQLNVRNSYDRNKCTSCRLYETQPNNLPTNFTLKFAQINTSSTQYNSIRLFNHFGIIQYAVRILPYVGLMSTVAKIIYARWRTGNSYRVCVCVCVGVCVCVILCDLETTLLRWPMPDLGCCTIEKRNRLIQWQAFLAWLEITRRVSWWTGKKRKINAIGKVLVTLPNRTKHYPNTTPKLYTLQAFPLPMLAHTVTWRWITSPHHIPCVHRPLSCNGV
jgi:hypothetical protein